MLTIFTPTYNRAYTLTKLNNSLSIQTCKNFEWLIIDDGSTDNTSDLVRTFIEKNNINIRYYFKENGGKHTATNLALDLAEGELFFVVDSDDVLIETAVSKIYEQYSEIKNDETFCGLCGLKAFFSGKIIGGTVNYEVMDATIVDYLFNYKYKGDKADIFKTKILSKYRFPIYEGEKWCPISYIWLQIGSEYKVRYFNQILYLAEYLPDGISLNRLTTRIKSPNLTMLYYSLITKQKSINYLQRIRAHINYWRFSFYSKNSIKDKIKGINLMSVLLYFPLGYLIYKIDNSKLLHEYLFNPNRKLLKHQTKHSSLTHQN
jgi:glycosyltransferase involved in cell wall biosynthesis